VKIITKTVFDILTGDIVEEKSYDYNGPVALCKGGGGSSGDVDYPDYMKNFQNDWLNNMDADTITSSVTDIANAALGNSPFALATAYSPAADITAYEAVITAFAAILAGISDTADWAALYTQSGTSIVTINGITEAIIVADVDAFADQLDDEINIKILPRFEAGMRSINAVTSSAFAIGRSNIEGFRNRDVAKHSSTLRINAAFKNVDIETEEVRLRLEGSSQMLRLMMQRISWEDSYMKTVVEGKRIKIVANKEEMDENIRIDKEDALWDLEVFQYGANLLASISGGTGSVANQPSTAQSVIGGALSGAAAGGMIAGASEGVIGGPAGIVIGGLLGAASALL